MKYPIRVLIVDDSILFREALKKMMQSDSGIQVVATATDPYDARDKIIQYEPDVITLDVEMPKMSGIEFLKQLIPQYPVPVVVVSSASMNVFDALSAGAVDFVAKPDAKKPMGYEKFSKELIMKIKIACTSKVGPKESALKSEKILEAPATKSRMMIAIGASTGGTEAVFSVLQQIPPNAPGIVIVQHMPPVFTKMYADRLNKSCAIEVMEAKTGDEIKSGRALLAPGGFHMKVRKSENKYIVECIKGDPVNGHCPSVDVLFDSVAEVMGKNAVGVIMTGMGYDGAKGLLRMRKSGAITIGQDERSCVVYGMPKVAFDIGAVEKQADLRDIPSLLFKMIGAR